MLNFQVTAHPNPTNDTITIKIRTFDRGRKEGFQIQMTEEWIMNHLAATGEGETYYTIRPVFSDGS